MRGLPAREERRTKGWRGKRAPRRRSPYCRSRVRRCLDSDALGRIRTRSIVTMRISLGRFETCVEFSAMSRIMWVSEGVSCLGAREEIRAGRRLSSRRWVSDLPVGALRDMGVSFARQHRCRRLHRSSGACAGSVFRMGRRPDGRRLRCSRSHATGELKSRSTRFTSVVCGRAGEPGLATMMTSCTAPRRRLSTRLSAPANGPYWRNRRTRRLQCL